MSADEIGVLDESVWHITVGTGPDESVVARMDGTIPATFKMNEETGEFTAMLPLQGCITLRPDGMSVEEAVTAVVAALFVSSSDEDDEGDESDDDEPEAA